ncbi:hypothetical protein ACFQ0Q_28390 [Streptomyces aureus]
MRARETGQRRALDRVGDQIEDARRQRRVRFRVDTEESRRVREATAAAR